MPDATRVSHEAAGSDIKQEPPFQDLDLGELVSVSGGQVLKCFASTFRS